MNNEELIMNNEEHSSFFIINSSLNKMDNMDLTCGHFVNPFTDIGFKIIFGQPASKELLITLLNELLAGEHRIENLIFLDKENHSDSMADAGIIYDLYCLTDTGEYIIVEMQNRFHSSFLDRTLFYMCRAIGRQVENLREKRRKERELQTGKPETEEDFLLSEPMQELWVQIQAFDRVWHFPDELP